MKKKKRKEKQRRTVKKRNDFRSHSLSKYMHWVILFLILPCLVATVHFKGCLRETLFVEK